MINIKVELITKEDFQKKENMCLYTFTGDELATFEKAKPNDVLAIKSDVFKRLLVTKCDILTEDKPKLFVKLMEGKY